MIRFLAFSLSRAWQGFWRNGAMSIAATATMTLMLLLLSGFFIVQNGLLAGLQFVEQKVEVVADLRASASDAEIEQLRLRVGTLPEVREVTFVSKETALQRFRDARAAQGEEDLTSYLDANPLHASLEVKLRNPSDFTAVDRRAPRAIPWSNGSRTSPIWWPESSRSRNSCAPPGS